MSDRACWVATALALHFWVYLLFVDASRMRCLAGFILTVAWAATAAVKTLARKGAFD